MSTFEGLIREYYESKINLDALSKQVDAKNKEIKNILTDMKINLYETDTLVAKKTVSVRETVNEEKLIDVLEHSTYCEEGTTDAICVASGLGIVKMKPYVDMDALEKAIYNGHISDDVMEKIAQCITRKEVISLKVSEKKN